jgi:hypothetical protein
MEYIDYFTKTYKWNIDHYKLVYDETINFMTIQTMTEPFLPPIGDVKILYEFLVLNTKYYEYLCGLKFNKYIDYDPSNILSIDEMIKKYIDKFTHPPPSDVWKIKPCNKCNKYYNNDSYKLLKCCLSNDYCQDCLTDVCYNCKKTIIKEYIIRFITQYGVIVEYNLTLKSCINDVVDKIAESIGFPSCEHRYVYNGYVIDNWSKPFNEYVIDSNNTFHIVFRLRGC